MKKGSVIFFEGRILLYDIFYRKKIGGFLG